MTKVSSVPCTSCSDNTKIFSGSSCPNCGKPFKETSQSSPKPKPKVPVFQFGNFDESCDETRGPAYARPTAL